MGSMKWTLAVVGLLIFVGCKSKESLDGDGGGIGGDAASQTCGNGIIEGDETCDGDCPTCNDNNGCTVDVVNGSPDTCDVSCSRSVITGCADTDGCCPAGC